MAAYARIDNGGDRARTLHVGDADASCAELALDASALRTSLSFLDDADDDTFLADLILPVEQEAVAEVQVGDAGDMTEELLLCDLLSLDVENLDCITTVFDSEEPSKQESTSGDGDAACVPVVIDAAPTPVRTPRVARKQAAPLRLKQKDEMKYLRAQVVELEAELANIKPPGAAVSSLADAETTAQSVEPTHSEDAQAYNPRVWERIAERQMEEKRRAEMENIKLRELLEGQLRVARSLERLLQRRSPSDTETLLRGQKRIRLTNVDSPESLYDTLRIELLERVSRVDQIVRDCGLGEVSTNVEDAQAKVDEYGHLYMESTVAKVYPFALARTADAIWRAITVPQLKLQNGNRIAVDATPNECKLQVDINLRLRRSQTTLHAHGLIMRHQEARRTLLMWQTQGQSDRPLLGHCTVAVFGSAVMVIEPLPSSSADSPYTVVKVCSKMSPELSSSSESHPGIVVDLIIGSFTQNSKMMFQMVENSLLQEAIPRRAIES